LAGRIGRLHSGQGRPGLSEPLERGGLANAGSTKGVELVKQKMRAGRLQERIGQVQLFGRLLSTRPGVATGMAAAGW